RAALRLRPAFADALCNLGLALRGQGKLDEAAAAWREALRIEPHHLDVRRHLRSLAQPENQLAASVLRLQEMIRLTPDDAGLHYQLGFMLLAGDRADEA